MNKERNCEINILKFAAVILVILIHYKIPGQAGETLRGMAAMAVPVFFMISGYYSYGITIKKLRKRIGRIFGLMVTANLIYFIWDICVELLSGRSPVLWLRENCTIKRLFVFLLTNESPFRGHLWFLGALLYSYLFLLLIFLWNKKSPFNRYFKNNQEKCLLVMVVILLSGNIAGGELLTQFKTDLQVPYIRNWLFCGIPFFCAAYCIHAYEERIRQYLNGKKLWCLLLLITVLNMIEVICMKQSELYITTILEAVIAFLLALHYQGRVQNGMAVFLGKLADKYGLWIYILQIIVIKNMQWLYQTYGTGDSMIMQWMNPFIAFLLTMLLAVIPVQIQALIRTSQYFYMAKPFPKRYNNSKRAVNYNNIKKQTTQERRDDYEQT